MAKKNKIKYKYQKLNQIFEFGTTTKGKTVKEVIDTEPGFIKWAFDNVKGFNLSGEAKQYYEEVSD